MEKTGELREISLFVGHFYFKEDRDKIIIKHLNQQDNLNLVDVTKALYGNGDRKSCIYFYATIEIDTALQFEDNCQHIYIDNYHVKVEKDRRRSQTTKSQAQNSSHL